jgi:hypothetical protein
LTRFCFASWPGEDARECAFARPRDLELLRPGPPAADLTALQYAALFWQVDYGGNRIA